ncbi:ComF family protein [Puteibacter caeruleilacunae]|nr:ComF family protein [Puteibacter caeruleilacunae]
MKSSNLLNSFIDLIFPRTCPGCGKRLLIHEKGICTHCLFHLPKTNFIINEDNPVAQSFWGRAYLQHAAAYIYFQKGSIVQHMMHQLKYHNNTEIGIQLGKKYGAELAKSSLFTNIDCIIPVPLHRKRLRKRGYNQSSCIARGISSALEIPVMEKVLIRGTNSASQTKKRRYERWDNVKTIFQVENPEIIKHKHVLLVDDIITTGATLEACAQQLLLVDGVKVSVAALCYADQ